MIDRSLPFQAADGIPPARGERKPGDEAIRFADWMTHGTPGPQLPALANGAPPLESAHLIPDQARVFNADGFFAATPLVPAAQTVVRNASALTVPPGDASAVPAPVSGAPSHADASPTGVRIANPGAAMPARAGAAPAKLAQASTSVANGGQPVAMALELEPLVDLGLFTEAEAVSRQAVRAADARVYRAGAQSTLRIAIRDIEHGLQILVATQALHREERERLTHEIAALLSRHGLVPRDVRIAGPASAGNSGKR